MWNNPVLLKKEKEMKEVTKNFEPRITLVFGDGPSDKEVAARDAAQEKAPPQALKPIWVNGGSVVIYLKVTRKKTTCYFLAKDVDGLTSVTLLGDTHQLKNSTAEPGFAEIVEFVYGDLRDVFETYDTPEKSAQAS